MLEEDKEKKKERIEKEKIEEEIRKIKEKEEKEQMEIKDDFVYYSADPYEILGVKNDDTMVTINRKYKKLSLIHHPDKPGGNKKRMKILNDAIDRIKEMRKNKKYVDTDKIEILISYYEEFLRKINKKLKALINAPGYEKFINIFDDIYKKIELDIILIRKGDLFEVNKIKEKILLYNEEYNKIIEEIDAFKKIRMNEYYEKIKKEEEKKKEEERKKMFENNKAEKEKKLLAEQLERERKKTEQLNKDIELKKLEKEKAEKLKKEKNLADNAEFEKKYKAEVEEKINKLRNDEKKKKDEIKNEGAKEEEKKVIIEEEDVKEKKELKKLVDNPSDPYSVLGLTKYASLEQIKKKYKELSLIYHPDKGGSLEDMIILNNAKDAIYNLKPNVKLSDKDIINNLIGKYRLYMVVLGIMGLTIGLKNKNSYLQDEMLVIGDKIDNFLDNLEKRKLTDIDEIKKIDTELNNEAYIVSQKFKKNEKLIGVEDKMVNLERLKLKMKKKEKEIYFNKFIENMGLDKKKLILKRLINRQNDINKRLSLNELLKYKKEDEYKIKVEDLKKLNKEKKLLEENNYKIKLLIDKDNNLKNIKNTINEEKNKMKNIEEKLNEFYKKEQILIDKQIKEELLILKNEMDEMNNEFEILKKDIIKSNDVLFNSLLGPINEIDKFNKIYLIKINNKNFLSKNYIEKLRKEINELLEIKKRISLLLNIKNLDEKNKKEIDDIQRKLYYNFGYTRLEKKLKNVEDKITYPSLYSGKAKKKKKNIF